jgi:hypothetical protein
MVATMCYTVVESDALLKESTLYRMVIEKSARKHGIEDHDIEYVCSFPINSLVLSETPEFVMLFGYDTIGRGLEVGYIVSDSGVERVIHAMKIRPSYRNYLTFNQG